jgi:glycosyltransferase involved in cell wall biosynthesis
MKILIWIPLPTTSAWRGEGISQTLEHIISNAQQDIEFHIVGNTESLQSIFEALGSKADSHYFYNQNILLTRFKNQNQNLIDVDKLLKFNQHLYFKLFTQRYLPGITKFINLMALPYYLLITKLHSYLIQKNLIFKKIPFVWAPLPSIPNIENIGSKLILSFWDAFVLEYSEFEVGVKNIISEKFTKLFHSGNYLKIITQSEHNKNFLINLFGVDECKIKVIRLGSPDYSIHLEKFNDFRNGIIKRDFKITSEYWQEPKYFEPKNRKELNIYINKYYSNIANKALLLRLLYKIKNDTKIIMISTQNRPYKGLGVALEIINQLKLQNQENNYLLITTCDIPTKLKDKYPQMYDDIIEFSRVSNYNHAFLLSISNLVLHPSFVEGGLGTYSMYEAASVGIPSLSNSGRHTLELTSLYPDLNNIAFSDFTKINDVKSKINDLLFNDLAITRNIKVINSTRNNWSIVASSIFDHIKYLDK